MAVAVVSECASLALSPGRSEGERRRRLSSLLPLQLFVAKKGEGWGEGGGCRGENKNTQAARY
jgi:hypothetical protein